MKTFLSLKPTAKPFFSCLNFSRFILVIIIYLLAQNISAQSGWIWQNPFPTGNGLTTIKFFDQYTGYILESESILKTTNSGVNWKFIRNEDVFPLGEYFFINVNIGYSLSDSMSLPRVYKTTNGGINWSFLSNLTLVTNPFSIYFTDENTGFIGCEYDKLLKTTNGGLNWVMTHTNSGMDPIRKIYFLNKDTGFVAGQSRMAKTLNGGLSWIPMALNVPASTNIYSVKFLNYSTGFAAGNKVIRTTNSGQTWDTTNYYFRGINCIDFADTQTGYAAGNNNQIFKTTNSGASWISQGGGSTSALRNIYLIDANTGYISGDFGIIQKTTNGGINWTGLRDTVTTSALNSVSFSDMNTGIAAGINGVIVRTTNSGVTWSRYNVNNNVVLRSAYLLNHLTGFATGYGFQTGIYKTTNSGLNWQNYRVGPNYDNFDCVYFSNENTGYVCGNGGYIYKSTNGGLNWTSQVSGTTLTLFSCYFLNPDTGYATGGNVLLKTSNGGINWIKQFLGNTPSYRSITFLNKDTAIIVGYPGVIVKTIDHFTTWSIQTVNASYINSVSFSNDLTGYAVADGGKIFKTTNGGENWSEMLSPTTRDLYSVSFPGDSEGFITGIGGIILKTTNGGNPIGTVNISGITPVDFELFQNYPNPFNPVTTIKFELPETESRLQKVTLIIYDILGCEVERLVSGDYSAGSYKVTWNAEKYSSGIYFYSIISSKGVLTKKMILLK